MGSEGADNIIDILWRGKFTILLAFGLLIFIAIGAYYYLDSKSLSSQLSQKDSDYNALDDKYNSLSYNHSALVKDHNDLSTRFTDISDRYNKLSVEDSYLRSSYDDLNGTIARFQETGGVVISLYYSVYQSGSSSNPKKTVEATAYNVGNKRADKIIIKCRTILNGSASVSEQTFTNVDPIDKRHSKWDYANDTQIDSVWVEL
jgi:hypothetical protein